jgi:hypothetical protein
MVAEIAVEIVADISAEIAGEIKAEFATRNGGIAVEIVDDPIF